MTHEWLLELGWAAAIFSWFIIFIMDVPEIITSLCIEKRKIVTVFCWIAGTCIVAEMHSSFLSFSVWLCSSVSSKVLVAKLPRVNQRKAQGLLFIFVCAINRLESSKSSQCRLLPRLSTATDRWMHYQSEEVIVIAVLVDYEWYRYTYVREWLKW